MAQWPYMLRLERCITTRHQGGLWVLSYPVRVSPHPVLHPCLFAVSWSGRHRLLYRFTPLGVSLLLRLSPCKSAVPYFKRHVLRYPYHITHLFSTLSVISYMFIVCFKLTLECILIILTLQLIPMVPISRV